MKLRMLSLFLALLLLLTTVCTAAAPEVSLFSTGNHTAGHHLKGNDRIIYDALMPLINDIATGKRSSTILRIGVLPSDDLVPKAYGLDARVDLQYSYEEQSPGYLTLICDYNFGRIMDALMADCPYEMYWYDKTVHNQMITGSTQINSEYYPYLEFYFIVEQGYCDPEKLEDPDGYGRFFLNTVLAAETVAIQEKALQIVEKYKDLDDYSKLLKYKETICDLVDYNYDAAANSTTPYGDPWQMIYVFDEYEEDNPNPSKETNVVCEGYSKAFQYLCDNTKFNSDKIQCYTVSGDMYEQDSKGLSGGGHMWNIVTMEDSQHYLVDVTNSDSGFIGQGGELFLAGVPMTTRDFNYKQGDQEITITRNCHVFTVNNREVIFADDSYADVEHGYWDDTVLILAESDYVYDNACTHLNTADEFRWAANYQSCKYIVTCPDCNAVLSNIYANVQITHYTNSQGKIMHTKFTAAAQGETDSLDLEYSKKAAENKTITLPLAADDTVSIMAVVYQDGQMIDIKTMKTGKKELSYLEFEGDYVKIFFLEKETSAPFLPNMQIDLH